jgi:uncharacterized membrane protein (UPF0136 family)
MSPVIKAILATILTMLALPVVFFLLIYLSVYAIIPMVILICFGMVGWVFYNLWLNHFEQRNS